MIHLKINNVDDNFGKLLIDTLSSPVMSSIITVSLEIICKIIQK